jgi:hypothetical protein
MKKEDRRLLIEELCARLPFGLKCYDASAGEDFWLEDIADTDTDYPVTNYGYTEIDSVRPYLRSESAMTEKERKEFEELAVVLGAVDAGNQASLAVRFIYEHHIDWRGLIPKGLAFEAEKGMYKFE